MKKQVLIWLIASFGTFAQERLPSMADLAPAPVVVERGPNHRVWERTLQVPDPTTGLMRQEKRQYVELASGLHYWQDNQWQESQALIQTAPGGAVCHTGAHKVSFNLNLNERGAIQLQTPDGTILRSHPLALAYVNVKGESVILALLHDSKGVILPPNQVLYADAFEGIQADILYTYTIDGFSQNIILREQPATPEACGLDPVGVRLEVMTEFLDNPQVGKQKRVTREGYTDEDLELPGGMRMVRGKAFFLGNDEDAQACPVYKELIENNGRHILLEHVDYNSLLPLLLTLPAKPQAAIGQGKTSIHQLATQTRIMPSLEQRQPKAGPMLLAQAAPQVNGLVLDYETRYSNQTNFTFRGQTTYLIAGPVGLYGTTTFEGGTVIKFADDISPKLSFNGPWQFTGGLYYPIFMTSMDDDTVGEMIAGSTGSPAWTNGATFMEDLAGNTNALSFMHVSYAGKVFRQAGGTSSWWHCQFVNCGTLWDVSGGNNGTINLYNTLQAHCATGAVGAAYVSGQQVTVDDSTAFFSPAPSNGTMFVNSLFTRVPGSTNWGQTYSWPSCYYGSDSSIYKPVGGAGYYLADNSTWRACGSSSINASLALDLRSRTTYGPVVFSNVTFAIATNFGPTAWRDTSTYPDYGYHYDPLDYTFGGCAANANITFSAGTSVGWFRTGSGWTHAGHGITLADNKVASFEGWGTNYCYWLRCNIAQEGGRGLWDGGYGPGGITGWATNAAASPEVRLRYTKCVTSAGEPGNHFREDWGYLIVRGIHSDFLSGGLGGYYTSRYLTNCLSVNCGHGVDEGGGNVNMVYQNCTICGGDFGIGQVNRSGTNYTHALVRNTVFEGVNFAINTNVPVLNPPIYNFDYNAFSVTPTNVLRGAHDVVTNSFNWQKWGQNRYYLPANSPLINAGTTNANLLGLYYFTTQTNQTQDATSIVDIGYHFLALNAQGQPVDNDGDGMADWWEVIYGFNPLVSDGTLDADYDGKSNYQEFLDGTDPNNANSLNKTLLAHFAFDSLAFAADGGRMPTFNNVTNLVAGILGNSAWFEPVAVYWARMLIYRDVEPTGEANINCRSGTVRFWFKPNWTSTNLGGTGPLTASRFVELGGVATPQPGWWALGLDYYGTSIGLGTTDAAGHSDSPITAKIAWTSNLWYQVALTYSPTQTAIYINGAFVTNGTGILYWPDASIRAGGMRVGGDYWGGQSPKGAMDELETYNYPLSGTDITNNYRLMLTNSPVLLAQTDPNGDWDYDGRSNLQEYQDGTDPFNSGSVSNVLLTHWTFDSGAFMGDHGQMPTFTNGALLQPGVISNSVKLANPYGTNTGLVYREIETNGLANINCRNGSVRLWFQPNWSTDGTNGGPRCYSPLLEIGRYDSALGEFELTFSYYGDGIYFHTGAFTNGVFYENTQVSTAINWQSNQWHQVVITYCATNTALYLDGQLQMTNRGVSLWPSATLRAQTGLHVGNNYYSAWPPNGQIDELETFNYPLSGADVTNNYRFMLTNSAVLLAQDDPNGDFDNDGMPNAWEYAHGLNPLVPDANTDFDLDGRSNLQEFQDGTDPKDPGSVSNLTLSRFRFDTSAFVSDQGQAPTYSNGVSLAVGGVITNAAFFSGSNGCGLSFATTNSNGLANLDCKQGTVRFWYQPPTNSGPTNCVFLQTGDGVVDWHLGIAGDGATLYFASCTNGFSLTNISVPVEWTRGVWRQIALTYSANTASLYLDGQPIASGNGVTSFPGPNRRSVGLWVGNDSSGTHPVGGQVDELEIFNYPLGAADINGNYQGLLYNTLDLDGDRVQNSMDAQPLNPNVGRLSITIDSPTNNELLR